MFWALAFSYQLKHKLIKKAVLLLYMLVINIASKVLTSLDQLVENVIGFIIIASYDSVVGLFRDHFRMLESQHVYKIWT